jgi:hypothetical protein
LRTSENNSTAVALPLRHCHRALKAACSHDTGMTTELPKKVADQEKVIVESTRTKGKLSHIITAQKAKLKKLTGD